MIAILTAVTGAILAVPAFFASASTAANLTLTPVSTTQSDVKYYRFDSPVSVFADDSGCVVSGANGSDFLADSVEHGDIPADKLYRYTLPQTNNTLIITLCDGALYGYAQNNEKTEIYSEEKVLDFDVEDGKIFALTLNRIMVFEITGGDADSPLAVDTKNGIFAMLSSDRHSRIVADKLAITGGRAFITVKSIFGNKQDICSLSVAELVDGHGARLDIALLQSDIVLSLSADDTDGALYALARTEIIRYMPTAGGLSPQSRVAVRDINNIYAFREQVYALDSLYALHRFSSDLSSDKVIAAAASDTSGFFNMPSSVTARDGVLYVADTLNGRIATLSKDGVNYANRHFDFPVSVAADNFNHVFVAYADNKIGMFTGGAFDQASERVITDPKLDKITQIAATPDGTLYILTQTALFMRQPNAAIELVSDARYKAIALGVCSYKLFALGADGIYGFDGAPQKLFDTPEDGISITADINDNVFVLCADKVVRADTKDEFALMCDGEKYTLGDKSGQIALCPVDIPTADGQTAVAHGDILVLDTYAHRLLKANGQTIGAQYITDSFDIPLATAKSREIIRTLTSEAKIYPLPMESADGITLAANTRVIVPYYNIYNMPEYSFVLVDDEAAGKLISGYVYKNRLSAAQPYSAPPSNICTVSAKIGASVKQYPSRFAPAVQGYEEVAENTKFPMLDFVQGYADEYGYFWYRVQLDNCDGFIPAVNVTTIDYYQANILPDYNAEIIQYRDQTEAPVYVLQDGQYNELGITLKKGTRIEVVGAYNSSEPYTQIKFLDERTHKTVTCYVKTAFIRYNGVNVVLIVAVIVIIITLILAVIIIARTHANKKKQLELDDDKTKNE